MSLKALFLRALRIRPTISAPTDAALTLSWRIANKISSLIAPLHLTPKDMRGYSNYLFIQGPYLVEEVAKALEKNPALFAHIPIDPKDLKARIMRALRCYMLRCFLLELSQRANEHFVRDHATAVRDALQVIAALRGEAQGFVNEDTLDRAHALQSAELVIASWQKTAYQKKPKRRKKKS